MLHKLKMLLVTVLVVVFGSLALAGCGGEKQESGKDGDIQGVTAGQNTQDTEKEPAADLFAKGQKIEGMTCDYVLTASGTTMQGKMWVQGDKVKHETSAQGEKVIMLFDGSAFYMYNPAQNMALKYTEEDLPGGSEEVDTPFDFTEEASDELITELETVDLEGHKCRVLLVQEKDSKDEVKMWVREDYGIPVRVEASDENGGKTVMEYKNVEVGALPASTFALPDGVQVQDISDMMSQLQQGAGN